ncbi:MAG: flavin reductase family protein [Kiloniellales bacterium]
MQLDPLDFRKGLGCFATGVTIVTTRSRLGEPVGLTVNSFNSVSLDPPLVLFSLGRHTFSLPVFLSTDHFAVNVLRDDQLALSNRFARANPDKWNGVAYETWDSGCPILPDALASFECHVRYTHDGGDHVIFVGEVTRMACDPTGEPLLFYGGRYCAREDLEVETS